MFFVAANGSVYSTRSSHSDGLLRQIKGSPDDKGYLRVKLTENGKPCFIGIHRLICEAFNGPSPGPHKPHVCHRNDIKDDNRAENLYWGSDLDNKQDAIRNGRTIPMEQVRHKRATQVGENAVCVKLTEEIVRQIRQRNGNGEKYAALAREFGTHPNTIRLICLRQTWTHVE